MEEIIQKVIDKLDEKSKNVILSTGLKIEQFLTDMLDEYFDVIETKKSEYDETEFYAYVLAELETIQEHYEEFDDDLFKFDSTTFIRLKAYLIDKPEMYREISIPSFTSFSTLAYSVFSSFNCYKGYDYKIKYKSNEFYPSSSNELFQDDDLKTEEEFLNDYDIKPGDKMIIEYDDNNWVFAIKILEISTDDENYITPLLLESNSYDILDGEREIFNLLMDKQLDEVKKLCDTDLHYKALMNFLNDEHFKISQETFEKRIDDLTKKYEGNLIDDIFNDFNNDFFSDENPEDDKFFIDINIDRNINNKKKN